MYVWLCWRVIGHGMEIDDFTMYAVAIRTFSDTLNGLFDDISHIRQQNEVICDYRGYLDYPDRPSGIEPLPFDQASATWVLRT